MILQSGDINRLKQLMASGQITEDQLAQMTLSGSFGQSAPQPEMPQQPNALARMLSPQEEFAAAGAEGDLPMGSMRNEATGKVTYFKPGGGGFSSQPYAAAPQAAAPRARMRVVGVGNGTTTELGEEDARALPVDYTRPGIDIPGLGKGRYTADGRYAVISNPDGTQTKVVLGYDAAASDRGRLRELKFRGEELDNEMRAEQIGALRDRRQLAAAPAQTMTDANPELDQPALEKRYGKPDKGYRWTQDGNLEPLPGGEVQQKAQSGIQSMQTAIQNIDELIGARGADGKLAQGAKPHQGFTDAVGLSVPKVFGAGFIPGTDTTNFNKRLEQLKGGAFLQAFETLKGGGQITEVEGKKATAAITRMDTAQSEEEFVAAAREFREAVESGMKKLAPKAGGAMPAAPAASQVPDAGARIVGREYDTPKGRAVWLGNGQWRLP